MKSQIIEYLKEWDLSIRNASFYCHSHKSVPFPAQKTSVLLSWDLSMGRTSHWDGMVQCWWKTSQMFVLILTNIRPDLKSYEHSSKGPRRSRASPEYWVCWDDRGCSSSVLALDSAPSSAGWSCGKHLSQPQTGNWSLRLSSSISTINIVRISFFLHGLSQKSMTTLQQSLSTNLLKKPVSAFPERHIKKKKNDAHSKRDRNNRGNSLQPASFSRKKGISVTSIYDPGETLASGLQGGLNPRSDPKLYFSKDTYGK